MWKSVRQSQGTMPLVVIWGGERTGIEAGPGNVVAEITIKIIQVEYVRLGD